MECYERIIEGKGGENKRKEGENRGGGGEEERNWGRVSIFIHY